MVFVDGWAIETAQGLPRWIFVPFDELTDFGKSGWFLVPLGLGLALTAALASPALSRFTQLVSAALAVRLAFLFTAIAVPSLFVTIIKRLIGRARPFVGGQADPFHYLPLVWRSEYASLPSGHAATAFAALVAFGLLWPRLRMIMWAYALIIALSRVVVLAHHPSDVVAGAIAGAVGAWLVRDWFAARRLGFAIDADGRVRTLPGPSFARIKRVARRLLAP
jgi:undecaprenyl-diphosphatase